MNGKRIKLIIIILIVSMPAILKAQITVTQGTGTVRHLLETSFLGGGIDLDTLKPIIFNGNATINSNQIGTFNNPTVSSPNMPIRSGIVMVTGACSDAGQGSHDGIQSTPASPDLNGNDVSIALYNTYHGQGGTQPMNDVACLSFTVIPKSEQMSFKYAFASEEYPGFVCSTYNDIFGLFVSGPYDENGNLVTTGGITPYQYHNIALIPNSTTPVTINTVNGGVSAGSVTPCILTNTQYFITNTNDNCYMNGYTKEFQTEVVSVIPCYRYKLELAICNIGDHSYNSAVYLAANSFRANIIDVVDDNLLNHNNTIYTKGCSVDTLRIKANYTPTIDETHNIILAGSAQLGQDFQLYDDNGNVVGSTLTIAQGDSTAHFNINFIHNPAKPAGTVDSLLLITEYVNDCTPQDTIKIMMREPETFTHTVKGGKTYCSNVLPINDTVIVSTYGAISYDSITYTYGTTNIEHRLTSTHIEQNTIPPMILDTIKDTLIVTVNEPMKVYIKIEDGCGREILDSIEYKIQGANTEATADRIYICEKEGVTLSCPESAQYQWTAEPADTSLQGIDTTHSPTVHPNQTTIYNITITDENGCIASDTIKIWVVPLVNARISLKPRRTTLTNTNVTYEDMTIDGYSRLWDFGDGNTSTERIGIESFPTADTGTYVVRLIAFNQANCPDTAYDTVSVVPDFTIWIPNAFMPGTSDQRTNYFYPQGSMLDQWELRVFNRWGEKIYDQKNKPWDGKLKNGDYAPQGTYVYDILYNDGNGLPQRKEGTFTLLPKNGKK
jgi:hypothetical protein